MGHKVKTVDSQPLRELQTRYNLSPTEITDRLGISLSAFHAYIRTGKMPAPLGPACVGIVAQLKGQVPPRPAPAAPVSGSDTLLAVRVPSASREVADKFLSAIGAKVQRLDI